MRRLLFFVVLPAVIALFAGCANDDDTSLADAGSNPFLEDYSSDGKADTGYLNPDGIEVEVDVEGDVVASSFKLAGAPAFLSQYAMTYLREGKVMYLESLAEDASSRDRVEWLVDGAWIAAGDVAGVDASLLRRFRIRGVNAVLLHGAANGVQEGKVFTAPVPLAPYDVYSAAGDKCATPDGHITLSQSVYWYLWNPERSGCAVELQDLKLTVTKMFAAEPARYPEYDKLIADGKVTAVVLFGQIGDTLTDSDSGVRAFNRMAQNLAQAGFTEVSPAPVGRRMTKHLGEVDFEIDLYSPRDFSGLSDYAHYSNFEKAVTEHEIIVYDGHSMLGASDFWARPKYPATYQIFLYGGCLGYEYYIRPIQEGKGGGWENLDIMSSVVEVSADANAFAAPALALIAKALEGRYDVSWNDLLKAVRAKVHDSTFGVSGVRDNCFTPTGSRCATTDPTNALVVERTAPLAIPDNDTNGVSDTIEVSESFTASAARLELAITHTWVGDLSVTLEHGGETAVVWDRAGHNASEITGTFDLPQFAGAQVSGAWTLRVVDGAGEDVGTVARWALGLQR